MFDKEKIKQKREKEIQDSLDLWNGLLSQEKTEENKDSKNNKDSKDKK
ncbi:MAG: hypothetical protein U0457_06175 [Candidatus Sericytochromatia bacterium]